MIIKTSYPFMKPPPSARLIRGHRLAQGLICFLPFSEDGESKQVFDLSGYGHIGTLVADTHFVPGPLGSALDFDGTDDKVTIPTSPLFNFGNTVSDRPFSVSIWVYLRAAHAARLISKYDNTAEKREWSFYLTGGELLNFRVFDDARDARLSRHWSFDMDGLLNRWLHLVGTYDGSGNVSSLRIYCNAVRVDDTNSSAGAYTAMHVTDQDVVLGYRDDTEAYLDGMLDLPMIYNRVLSPSEVAELTYNPFCMLERRARTALMSGYEVVVPPEGIVVLRRRRESA